METTNSIKPSFEWTKLRIKTCSSCDGEYTHRGKTMDKEMDIFQCLQCGYEDVYLKDWSDAEVYDKRTALRLIEFIGFVYPELVIGALEDKDELDDEEAHLLDILRMPAEERPTSDWRAYITSLVQSKVWTKENRK